MKRINLIIIFLAIALISCSKTDTTKAYSYTKWLVDSKGKKIKKSEYREFDSKGNKIKWVQYVDQGVLIDSFVYVYKNGLKTEESNYHNGGNVLFSKTVYTYNSDKKIDIEKEYNEKDKLDSYKKHTYFNLLEIVEYYTADGEMSFMDSITYDNKNNMFTDNQYLEDGSWFVKQKYEYDINGNLIKEFVEANSEFDGIGVVETDYFYDNKNRIIKEIVKSPVEPITYYYYIYTE